MADVAVYHNSDVMGFGASEVTDPVIVTNKRVGKQSIGDRLWLLTGEGQPRRFYLRGYFTASEIESAEDEGFRTRVIGADARFFSPMVELTGQSWFNDLKRSQGNFAFGFQVIADPRFVRQLERAARSSAGRTTRRRPSLGTVRNTAIDDLPPNRRNWYTVAEYRTALHAIEAKITEPQRQMLAAHGAAPDRILTVEQLAAAAGYETAHITSSQYGRLGHALADALGHDVNETVWTRLIGEDFRTETDTVAWEMEPALARVLIAEGWATASSCDVIKEIEGAAASLASVPETTRTALVQARVGQGPFRNRLVRFWGACAVTGVTEPSALRASHIKPWKVCSNEERLCTDNGLLLAANLDALFDAGLITFDVCGQIVISDLLPASDAAKLGLESSMRIPQLRPAHQDFLEYHRAFVFRLRSRHARARP